MDGWGLSFRGHLAADTIRRLKSDALAAAREYRALGEREWADMQAAGWRLVKVRVEVLKVLDPPKRLRRA
jgi:hypothetical protein